MGSNRGAAPEEAKLALLIEDSWQQSELGKRSPGRPVKEARRHGGSPFTASILGENRRALWLVAALFAPCSRSGMAASA